MFVLRVNLFFILSVCIVGSAFGANDLLRLYQKASEYDASYHSERLGLDASRQELTKSSALFYPKVQLTASIGQGVTDRTSKTTSGDVDTHLNYDTQSYALTVRQPLFNKEIMAGYKNAQAYVNSKESLMQMESAKLIKSVTLSYLEILYSQEKVNLLKSTINATEQQLKQAEQAFKKGYGTLTEVNEIKSNLDITNADLVQANNILEENRQQLFNMTGEVLEANGSISPDLLLSQFSKIENLDYWLSIAEKENPEIIAQQYSVESARQVLEKKNAGHYPVIDLVGVRSYSNNDSNNTLGSRFDTTTVAVQMNMPIFSGGYVNADIKQSALNLDISQSDLIAKRREISANIHKFYNNIQGNLRSILAYQQAVNSAQIAFEGSKKANNLGFKSRIDVLEAQQKLENNRLELSKATYLLVSNLIQLKFAAGVLNIDAMNKVCELFTK